MIEKLKNLDRKYIKQEMSKMTKNNNEINENIADLVEKYKTAKTKREENKAFVNILTLCDRYLESVVSEVFYKSPITREELKAEAQSCLFEVIRKYEPKGVAFTTYLRKCVWFHLIRYVKNSQNAIRIPQSASHSDHGVDCYFIDDYKKIQNESGSHHEDKYKESDSFFEDDRLNKIMLALKPPQQALLRLIIETDEDYEAMAKRSGRTPSALAVAKSRLFKEIRESLGE